MQNELYVLIYQKEDIKKVLEYLDSLGWKTDIIEDLVAFKDDIALKFIVKDENGATRPTLFDGFSVLNPFN